MSKVTRRSKRKVRHTCPCSLMKPRQTINSDLRTQNSPISTVTCWKGLQPSRSRRKSRLLAEIPSQRKLLRLLRMWTERVITSPCSPRSHSSTVSTMRLTGYLLTTRRLTAHALSRWRKQKRRISSLSGHTSLPATCTRYAVKSLAQKRHSPTFVFLSLSATMRQRIGFASLSAVTTVW